MTTPITTASTARPPVTWRREGPVAVVRMDDPDGRNTFTPALRSSLVDAMAAAAADPASRAVLVEGRAELFCAGGPREELETLSHGRASFDDDDFFQVFAHCPLPVVAAVQGHAIGGGLALALHADMLVLSERSLYWANFMRYGFTPGMATTALLPSRFGELLGTEMLFTGRPYRGAELRSRNAPVNVVAHPDVPATAHQLAIAVAGAPRPSVELLKRRFAASLLATTADAISAEAEMHRTSFRLPEVRERIRHDYGTPAPAPPSPDR